jgi:hypothetical protein
MAKNIHYWYFPRWTHASGAESESWWDQERLWFTTGLLRTEDEKRGTIIRNKQVTRKIATDCKNRSLVHCNKYHSL